jgi:cytochrome c oxidase assembly protein subunit 20
LVLLYCSAVHYPTNTVTNPNRRHTDGIVFYNSDMAPSDPKLPTQPAIQDWTTIKEPPPPSPSPSAAEADAARAHLATDAAHQRATIADAWASVKAGDFLSVHQAPCSRTGFLTGIGGGAAIGGLRFVLGAGIPKAANWAVGAGVLGAVISYEVCQAGRRREREKMKRVVEVYDRKQAEVRAQTEEKRRERERLRAEEEARKAEEAQKKGWKLW